MVLGLELRALDLLGRSSVNHSALTTPAALSVVVIFGRTTIFLFVLGQKACHHAQLLVEMVL
jgi:hypothetical protein